MATVAHNFISLDEKEQKLVDDADINSSRSITAIVVIGKTGAGKSSLINLFCSSARVGHTTKSQTLASNLFNENEQRYWLDTQGASDSNGVPDGKVLCAVLKELYNKNITKIKIIWCVSGDTQSRANEEFQKQARFIKNGLGDKNNDIWKSCLIIKKQGDPKPSNGLDGLLAAASMSGSDINYCDNNRLFGYSFYDPNVPLVDHTLTMALKYITDETQKNDFLKSAGFWSKDDIKKELNKLLLALPTSSIQFSILKCSKCGVMGDPRFIYALCHAKKEKHHDGNLIPYHHGSILKYHLVQSPEYYHPGPVIKYHSGYLKTIRYHSGSTTSVYYHSSSRMHWNWFMYGDMKWRHNCCDKRVYYDDGDRRDNGCSYSYSKHTCCDCRTPSSPCSSYKEYSCCNKSESSEGCVLVFECCKKLSTDKEGCKLKFVCCNKPTTNKGCVEKYSCCDAPLAHKGCKMKYSCCDKESGKEGCIERCSNADCHAKWGNGPGCINISSSK